MMRVNGSEDVDRYGKPRHLFEKYNFNRMFQATGKRSCCERPVIKWLALASFHNGAASLHR